MDLRPQRPQLRLARGDLELQGAALRVLRGGERPEQVVKRARQQEQRAAEAEQQRRDERQPCRQPGKDVEPVEHERPALPGREPHRRREEGREQLRAERAEEPRQRERGRGAHPERAQPGEAQQQREGDGEHQRLDPAERRRERQLERDQDADDRPGPEVGKARATPARSTSPAIRRSAFRAAWRTAGRSG